MLIVIRRKARVQAPGQISKQNTKSISSAITSQQISGKKSQVSKNLSFGVDFKLKVPQLMFKINTHNISGVKN